MPNKRPILVTGAHRTGTTWVGRMVAAHPQLAYISEPLNVLHRPGVFHMPVHEWYVYIHEQNGNAFLPAFNELLDFKYDLFAEIKSIRSQKDFLRMMRDVGIFTSGRFRDQRALIKDPFAIFSLPWFAQTLNAEIVVTIRHPAGFASSLKRLNWDFDFQNLLSQPALMKDHLEEYRAEMESVSRDDIIGQSALLWNMIYRIVDLNLSLIPDLKIVRHEDLSLDPVAGFEKLYKSLNLEFTEKIRDVILNSSNSENPAELSKKKVHSVKLDSRANMDNWKKRLTPEEISRIRHVTEETAHRFYPEADWGNA